MSNTRPFVGAALVCEKVLHEKDGVLSVIRMVDTFYVEPLKQNVPGVVEGVELTALAMLKSGDVKGESEISFKFRTPQGITIDAPQKFPVLLNGGEHGANVIMRFNLPVPDASAYGLYWFDVLWNGDVLTSVPFKLVLGPREPAADKPG